MATLARKKGGDRWLGEVKGILALAAAGFGLVALAMFDPALPPAVQSGPVGPVGVWLGWVAFQSFGYAGFLFPLLLGAWGVSAFVRTPIVRNSSTHLRSRRASLLCSRAASTSGSLPS